MSRILRVNHEYPWTILVIEAVVQIIEYIQLYIYICVVRKTLDESTRVGGCSYLKCATTRLVPGFTRGAPRRVEIGHCLG